MIKTYRKIRSWGMSLLLLGTAIACSEEEPIYMAPTFNLNEVSDIMRTSATFSGTISGDMTNITSYGFQYSLSEDFTANLTQQVEVGEKPESGLCQVTVKGLEANERYYYRLYATTGASTVYSRSEYFQTTASSAPMISELVVDSIGENIARFRCVVEDIGDEYLIECGVGYKTSADKTYIPIPSDSIVPVSIAGVENMFFVEVTGLEPATNYSFRPYAKNSADANGETGAREGYGAIANYKTENLLSAAVETVEIVSGNIGMNSVDVSGRVTSAVGSNGAVDEVGFCYSQTNETPIITDSHVTATFTKLGEYFSATIPDLQTATTYYVRAYAKNTVKGQERIGYGAVYEITTTDIATPQVEWVLLTNEEGYNYYDDVITATSISKKAKITNYDKGALIEKGFIWSENNGEITIEEARKNKTFITIDLNTGENVIDGTITGLKMNTSYYIRAYAIYQAAGIEEVGYTWTHGFSTSNFERPNLDEAYIDENLITRNSAVLQGRISNKGNGEFIDKGFVISLHHNGEGTYEPTLKTDGVMVLKADDEFKATVTGLRPGTNYAVRPYIISTLGGVVDTTYAWYRDLYTDEVVFPKYTTNYHGSTISTISFSMSISEYGDGEVIEKGFLWKKNPDDGSWPYFDLKDGADGYKAFDDLSNDTDTLTMTGLEVSTSYMIKGYIKIRVDGYEYISYSGTHGVGTGHLNLTISSIETSATEMVLTGYDYDPVEGITEYGFCWTTDETVAVPDMKNFIKASAIDENNNFKATITGLTPNTKYYVGVYAKIEDKIYYDDGRWDPTTKGIPTIDSNPSPDKKD